MVLVQCSSKLSYLPLPNAVSLLFEPTSFSMALTHTDSSLSLYPSLSSFSSLNLKAQTVIAPPSSSSSFLVVKQGRRDPCEHRVIFLVAGPCRGDSRVLMRFYILQKNRMFANVRVFSNQKGISVDSKSGVLLDVEHGVSVQVVGSVNFFVIHSVSFKKIWVFGVKLVSGGKDGDNAEDRLKLMKCAVIACCSPVWSISMSFGFLMLGERGGVRVLNLRQLVKGKQMEVNVPSPELVGTASNKKSNLPNGIVEDDKCHNESLVSESCLKENTEKDASSSKQKSVKCRQDPADCGSIFIKFTSPDVSDVTSMNAKAISIIALTPKNFMILDSSGNMYILDLLSANRLPINRLRHLPYEMKVHKMAVLPDVLSKTHVIWVSDGFHSVHKLALSVNEAHMNKMDEDDCQNEPTQLTVANAIFTCERVLDVVPLAANAVSILGKGNIYVYAIP